ncbi:hypothetical protein N8993_08240 [Pseudomonadales bacterium]|nr:hypothetical protein [Pseudomonadales bacterium]
MSGDDVADLPFSLDVAKQPHEFQKQRHDSAELTRGVTFRIDGSVLKQLNGEIHA